MQYVNDYSLKAIGDKKVILFGASKLGIKGVEYLKKAHVNIDCFFDNDKGKWGKYVEGIKVKSFDEIEGYDKDFPIVITSSYFQGISKQLANMGYTSLFSYIDAVGIEKLDVYPNKYIHAKQIKDVFDNVNRISLELSNLCNYAAIHKKCPLSKQKEHVTLSSQIVYNLIDELAELNFDKTLSFHRYNEPLVDPRLFSFIKYAKAKCKDISIFILSNGYYLNQSIADELVQIGVTKINCTAYSKDEFKRLSEIKMDIPYKVYEGDLDDRLDLYEKDSDNTNCTPCYAPLDEIIINKYGKVGLCCLEWNDKYIFGDLGKNSLKDILLNSNIVDVFNELVAGKRKYNICKSCGWSR